MSWSQRLEFALFVIAITFARVVFRSQVLYDLDSVNFALAMNRFDPRVHQPHPPGYPVYIWLARSVNTMAHDANLALVILSIAASCGAIVFIYKLALNWFGQSEARLAATLFLLSPSAWFHGTVALTYSLEAFFSAALGYLCWGIDQGTLKWIVPAGILLGISAGVRPSSLMFLAPLYLYCLRKAPFRRILAGILALVLTLIAWFVPMVVASGGLHVYFGALTSLWHLVPSRNTLFNSSPATSFARACVLVFMLFLNFGIASLALVRAMQHRTSAHHEKTRFTIVWIAPALSFFIFIFFQFINSGYLLLLSPPICLWLSFWIADWYRKSRWSKRTRIILMGTLATTNIAIFLLAPFYCSYRSVLRFQAEISDVQSALPKIGSPKDTLIIGFDSHFLGYRHAGFYLPEYTTVQYPETELQEGTRIFQMHHRDTRLLEHLPAGPWQKFVLFPLPDGDPAYSEYVAKVKALLPAQVLRTTRIGGKDYVTGPITLLPLLFPRTAAGDHLAGVSSSSRQRDCCKQP